MSKQKIIQYRQAISYLESFSHQKIKDFVSCQNKLTNFYEFLSHFDHPQKKLNFIHVAGTSGKGSVCSLIQSGLQNGHNKVGLYTSPHLNTAIERIKINDLYIDLDSFLKAFRRIKLVIDQGITPPSYLGLLLTIGFLYWQEQKCDYVVLETGLGGDNDHTNIIPAPLVSVITNIGLDHQKQLGHSLNSIAQHKAGIIKKGSVFFTTEKNKNILKLFSRICLTKKVPLNIVRLTHSSHEQENLVLAQEVVQYLTTKKILKRKNQYLPARQEVIQKKPLIILDGAHNPDKIKALISTLQKQKIRPDYLLVGFSGNKDWQKMLRLLVPLTSNLICTRSLSAPHAAENPQLIAGYAQKINKQLKIKMFWDNSTALHYLLQKCQSRQIALITGSLYLIGEIRAHWLNENYILTKRRSF